MIHDKLVPFGIMLVFAGVIIIILGSLLSVGKGKDKAGAKSAGIVFIGPFPFGWASDKQTFYTLLAVTLVFFLLWLVFFRRM